MKQISHYPFAFVTCVVFILSIFKCNSTYAQELEVITYTDTYAAVSTHTIVLSSHHVGSGNLTLQEQQVLLTAIKQSIDYKPILC